MLQCALEGLLGVKPQVRSYSTPVLTICHGAEAAAPHLLALCLFPPPPKPVFHFRSGFVVLQVQR